MRQTLIWIMTLVCLAAFHNAQARDLKTVCRETIAQVEQKENVPRGMLYAIALTESGRWDKASNGTYAWPWTIRAKDDAFVLSDMDEAIATVKKLKNSGRKNIDVGCMQVNLMYHPDAFSSLEQAFSPLANAEYAARFLKKLRERHRSWARAIEHYHSSDPQRGRNYRKKVYGHWQNAKREMITASRDHPNVKVHRAELKAITSNVSGIRHPTTRTALTMPSKNRDITINFDDQNPANVLVHRLQKNFEASLK